MPPPSPGTDDIVMDFELGYSPEQLGRAARQALEELRGRSRDTQRSLADKVCGGRVVVWGPASCLQDWELVILFEG